MQIRTDFQNLDAIGALFQTTFTTSEGPEEGRVVSALARALVATTPNRRSARLLRIGGGCACGCDRVHAPALWR